MIRFFLEGNKPREGYPFDKTVWGQSEWISQPATIETFFYSRHGADTVMHTATSTNVAVCLTLNC